MPYVFNDEEVAEEYDTLQYSLKCKNKTFVIDGLSRRFCHEDFGLKPKLRSLGCAYYPDVFFVNTTSNVIFFIYDDRGCEVIAEDREAIRPIYERFNDWIGEYDREGVRSVFE